MRDHQADEGQIADQSDGGTFFASSFVFSLAIFLPSRMTEPDWWEMIRVIAFSKIDFPHPFEPDMFEKLYERVR